MRKSLALVAMAIGLTLPVVSCADDSQPHEAALAVAHVADAIEMYEDAGLESTLAHYDDPASIDGEFYVVVIDADNTVLNHPYRPTLTGTTAQAVTMDDGRLATEAISASVSSGQPAWVSFDLFNPVNDDLERKHVWAVPHDGYVFVAGYYEPFG